MKIIFPLIFILLILGCSTVSQNISSEYYNVGNAYYDVGNFEKAIEYFKKAIEEDDSSVNRIRYNLAIAYSESGRVEEGLKHFFILLDDDPENLQVLQSVAYAYYLNENTEDALLTYNKILSIFEYDSTALYNKAMILIEKGDREAAKVLLEKLYEVDTSLEVVHQLGSLYREFEMSESYVYLFETALIDNKKDLEILTGLVEYYETEEMYFKVLEFIDVVLDLEELEDSTELLFKKGSILILELNDYNNGFLNLKNAVESGYKDMEQIKLLLEDEKLFQADELIAYFKSNELY